MNTPSHIAASLLVWRDEKDWLPISAIVVGGLVPDLPMVGFYAYQKLWAGHSESEIWGAGGLYFQSNWQLLFDLFNSIPIFIVIAAVCYYFGQNFGYWRCGYLLAASALLHMLCDLPVHHDDGHRHILPLSNWKFASPVS